METSKIQKQSNETMPNNDVNVCDKDDNTPSNFIKHIIENDIKNNKNDGRVATRFPPEPNGYLHIGHAKSICLNFGLAKDYKGVCNLRFDDTNPIKESIEYVDSIQEDVRWLGFDWGKNMFYASDYFHQIYQYAIQLIKKGKAYVCCLNNDQIRQSRGTLTEPGTESPYRNRSIDENLNLFERMKNGEFEEGTHVLRAKINMASPNIVMRDPVIFRIRKIDHHRTKDAWCIYPMYDFAHCLSDAIEGITHSICTMEFENNRELYDWVLNELNVPCHPQQIEFARLNMSYTVLSKRKLIELVKNNRVMGWNDPRMPTIAGLRRRGYSSASIRNFCERIGVARKDSVVDIALLEHCLREDLNKRAPRYMAVLRPLKIVIDNYPVNKYEKLEAVNNPEDPSMGSREISFSKYLYIEEDDFQLKPQSKFYRLYPGNEVRLRYAYYIKCVDVKIDEQTNKIKEIHCTYDPSTRGGDSPDGRKVKSTLHWVSADDALEAEVRLFDHLFTVPNPYDYEDLTQCLNHKSFESLHQCLVEPKLIKDYRTPHYQFERLGYFCLDQDANCHNTVFNRTVTLKDTWAKIQKKI